MRRIDELYLKRPYFGSRRIGDELNVNRKRVQRLMRLMNLEAIYPKPRTTRTTVRCPEHKIYPYLLRNLEIVRPNQVWSTDITYIPLRGGFVYLTVVLDWYSRYVLAWRLSNSLDSAFCLEALQAALEVTQPEIFNTDQGVQFTSVAFTSCLEAHGIAVSMDGRGRALDNVFVERLWRTVKYEEVYLKDYDDAWQAEASLTEYFTFYCHERRHQSLDKRTPADVYGACRKSSTKRRVRNIPR
jgi:putative transposase